MATPSPAISPLGRPELDAHASRTIDVEMIDSMRFTPQRIVVRAGETVRFRVRNKGKLPHEFVFGTPEDLATHARSMRETGGTEHMHMQGGEHAHEHGSAGHHANVLQVAPGEAGTLTWRFGEPGEYRFACLVPGHAEAGMTGVLVVERR
jgi:uncharacterized cupredoxin-like copper-binding protein